jgi:hypothetical protein
MMFARWCELHEMQAVPASPVTISRFINGIAELGIDRVWEAVQEISRAHWTQGYADPTCGPGPVTSAVNVVSGLQPPRSWPKETGQSFKALPYDMQKQILDRETERDRAVRKAQNEVASLKKEIGNAKIDA